jgi:hypothetical protein
MALPKIVPRGRKIILLRCFKDETKDANKSVDAVVVNAKNKLREAAKRGLTQPPSEMWQASGLRLLKLASVVARHL